MVIADVSTLSKSIFEKRRFLTTRFSWKLDFLGASSFFLRDFELRATCPSHLILFMGLALAFS